AAVNLTAVCSGYLLILMLLSFIWSPEDRLLWQGPHLSHKQDAKFMTLMAMWKSSCKSRR
ncbi:unnamed protein product, partial [Tetraodon nigroviridis]